MPKCDVCDRSLQWGMGYGLTTTQVVTTEAYWEWALGHQLSFIHAKDPSGDTLGLLVQRQAAVGEAWLICETCSKLFDIDREVARKYSRPGISPPGNGPALASEAGIAAGFAWSKLYNIWPVDIQIRSQPPPSDGSICDFCRRQVYEDEELTLMKESDVASFEAAGLLKRHGGPSKQLEGEDFWVCCPLCTSRANRLRERQSGNVKTHGTIHTGAQKNSGRRKWWQFWKAAQ